MRRDTQRRPPGEPRATGTEYQLCEARKPDLRRLLVAIAYAITIIAVGDTRFALGILPLAIIAAGELFDLYVWLALL